jgi:septal ring-binding cell division protein DamX
MEFSLTSVFFWSLSFFLLLAWIFVLGILVGRGFLPEEVKTFSEVKKPIAKPQDMVSNRKTYDFDHIKGLDKEPHFKFYDELLTKRKETPKKTPSRVAEKENSRRTTPAKKIEPSKADGKYTLQLASLESEIKALSMVNQLIDRGYPAYYYEATVNGTTYYRVSCGRFSNKEAAADLKLILAQKEMVQGFVTSVRE